MTTEEKLIALADKTITLWEEHEFLGDEDAWLLAKALKLVLEQRDMPDYPTAAEVRRYDQIRDELDALVREL